MPKKVEIVQQNAEHMSAEQALREAKINTRRVNRANTAKLAAGVAAGAGGFLPGMALHNNWFGVTEWARPGLAEASTKVGEFLPDAVQNLDNLIPNWWVKDLTPDWMTTAFDLEKYIATPEALGGALQTAGMIGIIGMMGVGMWKANAKRKQMEAMSQINKELIASNPQVVQELQGQVQTGSITPEQANQALQNKLSLVSPEQPQKEEETNIDKAVHKVGKASLGLFGLSMLLHPPIPFLQKINPFSLVAEGMGVESAAALGAGMSQLSLALLAPVLVHSTFKAIKAFRKDSAAAKIEREKIDAAEERLKSLGPDQAADPNVYKNYMPHQLDRRTYERQQAHRYSPAAAIRPNFD